MQSDEARRRESLKLRSPKEIVFRLRQELVNRLRAVAPPGPPLKTPLTPMRVFADPSLAAERVRASDFESAVVGIAEQVCLHRFPVFGTTLETGPDIDWRRDYRNGKSSGNDFFRRVPYLDFAKVGDHKWIWELNRHQHLIALAQAFLATGRPEFIAEIEAQLTTWHAQNAFVRGINWASALEVAFRALSWIWVDALAGAHLRPEVRLALQNGLWLHARHLEANLSVYFSPNTHLLGEAVALHAIGTLYPDMPGAARFARTGARIAEGQLDFQMRPDGSHFEQSTYYHVYAVDFFVLYYLLAGRPLALRDRLRRMADYLDSIVGPARRLFASGDDDGGRLFHPYGDRDRFGRATLATCATLFPDLHAGFDNRDLHEQAAWWLDSPLPPARPRPARATTAHQGSGMVSIEIFSEQAPLHVLFDAGPFGWGGAGHSHADTLNILVRLRDQPVLADSGTYTYVADAIARDWFRGTAAHNTIRVDGLDQADPTRPFRWDNKPEVRLNRSSQNYADAQCAYRGIVHRRRLLVRGTAALIVIDDVTGPAGDRMVEQFWNLAGPHALLSEDTIHLESGWRSDVYGSKLETMRKVVRRRGPLPMQFVTALLLNRPAATLTVNRPAAGGCLIDVGGIRAVFPDAGDASWHDR